MSNKYDVVLTGDVFCDLVFTGLDRMPRLGEELYARNFEMAPGGVFITAAALARLGLRTGVCTWLGDDPFSRFLLDCFAAEGLDTSLVQRYPGPMPTLSVALSFPSDRAFITYRRDPPCPGPAELLAEHDFRHLHVASLAQLFDHFDLIEMAHERGATISLDCQWCPDIMARPDVADKIAAARVNAFLPNLDEALALTGAANAADAMAVLSRWAPNVAITMGGDGVLAAENGATIRLPALPVDAVDTTGAGDAFDAGFIYGLLNNKDFEHCLRVASVCGGLSTTACGGATAAPRLAEVQSWLERGW